jgi:hypothetical protein
MHTTYAFLFLDAFTTLAGLSFASRFIPLSLSDQGCHQIMNYAFSFYVLGFV